MNLPCHDNWYRVERVTDTLSWIYEPSIDQFYRCNIWHIRGRDRDLLIDSGSGIYSLRGSVARLSERPVTAVASHVHFDHVGCHHEFDHCLVHDAEREVLLHPNAHDLLADRFASEQMFTELPEGGFDAENYTIHGVAEEKLERVEEGSRLDLGNLSFEVFHLPGHSPGSIALWDERSGTLFSGDTLYDGELVTDAHHSNMAQYITSMKRLLELPVTAVHGGHFASFGREKYQQMIREFLDQYDK